MHFNSDIQIVQSSRTLFENGEIAVTLPTAALPPLFRLWECLFVLGYSASRLHISHGLTFTFSAPSSSRTVSLDKMSEGLLWLGTLSLHSGTSKFSSTWKIRLIILSRSSFADQLLRKEPRTTSLSVNKTVRQFLIRLC